MASVEIVSLKRQRDDTHESDLEDTKKHKSFDHILSILDEDEEEPTEDLSSLMTTLRQELSSSDDPESSEIDLLSPMPADPEEKFSEIPASVEDSSSSSSVSNEEDDKERVMRHLLEASDDELGIPTTAGADDGEEAAGLFGGGGDGFLGCDGLWEFEDEAANYYTLLQSELFM